MTPAELDAFAVAMAKRGVVRAKFSHHSSDKSYSSPVEIDLDPLAVKLGLQQMVVVDKNTPFPAGEPEPDFLFASSIPVTSLETQATMPEPPAEAAAKP